MWLDILLIITVYCYNRLHRDFYIFSDEVRLKVTDGNGTEIASTQVVLYKCRTATKYVHLRYNVFVGGISLLLFVNNKEKENEDKDIVCI